MTDNLVKPVELPAGLETKECPFCAEEILVRAKKCKHCGEFVDNTGRPVQTHDPATIVLEATEYEGHPPMFRNKPFAFIVTLVLCFFGIGILIFIIWWIRTLCTTLTVTSRRTILRKGLFSKLTSEVYHKDVRNVQIAQRALQRLFNVGTIEISSAGQADFEIAVECMFDPNRVKNLIDESKNT